MLSQHTVIIVTLLNTKSMKINGWTILFHPLFNNQWQQLLDLVKSLRSRLSQPDFVRHPQVKLFKALTTNLEDIIDSN